MSGNGHLAVTLPFLTGNSRLKQRTSKGVSFSINKGGWGQSRVQTALTWCRSAIGLACNGVCRDVRGKVVLFLLGNGTVVLLTGRA